ncbi:MAG: diguanylate cyclase [Magnetococcus sp. DMHC-1]|nr:diguanylate cyclase [Magnetococcales bacterium]
MHTSVLFVGDEQKNLDALVQGYGPPAYMVYQALSCRQALDILRANPVDILVTDLQMPCMNSMELIHEAKKIHPIMQVILMRNAQDVSALTQALPHYDAFEIIKPIHPGEFRVFIERCSEIQKTRLNLHQTGRLLEVETTNRKQAEDIANRALATRIAISALLETSLEPLSLAKQIDVIMEIILTIPWFSGKRKGAFFLLDEETGNLRMVGQKNLSEPLLELCAQVPLGHCLCGKAAAQREIIFKNRIDDDHVNRYDGIQEHGHYCVPIIGKDRLLGVLSLYVPVDHQRNNDEDALLGTVSNTLTLVLEHRHTEIELRRAEEKLRFMAYHDPLTGLHNRQYFNVTFNKVFNALQNPSRRQNERPFQGAFLAIFDIDHFKKVNDTYGHLIGDEVLVLFARIITECFRDKDASFRFGGEEFVVLLNDISAEIAEKVLNRFRLAIEAYSFPQVGRVTVSIGGVQIEAGELSETLLEKADKALYFSKSNGRNQVNMYHALIASGDLKNVDHGTEEVDLW